MHSQDPPMIHTHLVTPGIDWSIPAAAVKHIIAGHPTTFGLDVNAQSIHEQNLISRQRRNELLGSPCGTNIRVLEIPIKRIPGRLETVADQGRAVSIDPFKLNQPSLDFLECDAGITPSLCIHFDARGRAVQKLFRPLARDDDEAEP